MLCLRADGATVKIEVNGTKSGNFFRIYNFTFPFIFISL